jgi:hypothetical protein
MEFIKRRIRQFLGIEADKKFMLEYGDATASRVDRLEAK